MENALLTAGLAVGDTIARASGYGFEATAENRQLPFTGRVALGLEPVQGFAGKA
jgi:hypothetical protein